jgi:hypothetical protein
MSDGLPTTPLPAAIIIDRAIQLLNALDKVDHAHAHQQRMVANRACLSLQTGRLDDAARFFGELTLSAKSGTERSAWLDLAAALRG